MYNGVGYIIPIVVFSLLYNLVKFFEIETIYIQGEVGTFYTIMYEAEIASKLKLNVSLVYGAEITSKLKSLNKSKIVQ
jgi:hypothetical protein